MALDFLKEMESAEVPSGRSTDIGGSQRHIWFGAIYDRPKLEGYATKAKDDAAYAALSAAEQKKVDRAVAILNRGNTAGEVEAAFGELGKLEEALPALARKSGAYAQGSRVLVSMTREEFAELGKRVSK